MHAWKKYGLKNPGSWKYWHLEGIFISKIQKYIQKCREINNIGGKFWLGSQEKVHFFQTWTHVTFNLLLSVHNQGSHSVPEIKDVTSYEKLAIYCCIDGSVDWSWQTFDNCTAHTILTFWVIHVIYCKLIRITNWLLFWHITIDFLSTESQQVSGCNYELIADLLYLSSISLT